MLKIENLHVFVENKHIVKGVKLTIKPGEVHVLMGPNGSGKSSLAHALMGSSNYKVKGKIVLNRKNIANLPPNERAQKGLFLAFQNPLAITGVSVSNLLRAVNKDKRGKSVAAFYKDLKTKTGRLGIDESLLKRGINDGFSGGEKKKMEILQLIMLEPKYAIIDEVDTGLDVDALKVVAKGVKDLAKVHNAGILLITHYQRILDFVKPDKVHVMLGGKVVKSGCAKLAEEIEKNGYGQL